MSKEASGQPYKKVYGKPETGDFDEVYNANFKHQYFGDKQEYDEYMKESVLPIV